MKFEVDTKLFKAALSAAVRFINPRSPLPILSSHLLVDAKPNLISLTATDLGAGIVITIDADVSECGSCAIPGKDLANVIGLAGTDKVRVEMEPCAVWVYASGGSKTAKWRLQNLPADDYPGIGALEGEAIELPAAALGNAIEEAAIAAAKDAQESRAVLTGICLTAEDGNLRVVATDGRRMCVAQRAIEFRGTIDPVVVPAGALEALAKALGSVGNVMLYVGRKQAWFEHGNTRWFARLLEGRFPDWTKVVPKPASFPWTARCNRKVLMEAIRGGLLTAQEKSSPNRLRFQYSEESLLIESNTPDLGESRIIVEATGEGDQVPPVGWNGKYVLDGLSVIDTEEVVWEIQGDLKSSVLRPADSEDFRYVLMPIKLRDVAADEMEAASK